MKSLDSSNIPPTKPVRFRFPFKQNKSSSIPSSYSGGGGGGVDTTITGSSTGGSPPSSRSVHTPSSTPRFLSFRKSKPLSPVSSQKSNAPRKSLSFTAGSGGKDSGSLESPLKNNNNMDWKRKISVDHTDVAYREAVGRLRAMLSPRPGSSNKHITDSPVKTDVESPVGSIALSPSYSKPGRKDGRFTASFRSMFGNKDVQMNPINLNNQSSLITPMKSSSIMEPLLSSDIQRETDLFGFIEKQGEYIAQLEKETKYSRDELSSMLGKVKEVIAENEALHHRQKRDLLSNMIQQLNEKTDGYNNAGTADSPRSTTSSVANAPISAMKKSNVAGSSNIGGGSNVILESRVAELDAQLAQARRSLRIAQEEILELRKGKLEDLKTGNHGQSSSSPGGNKDGEFQPGFNIYADCDLHRTEIETLVREKEDLLNTMHKLKQMVNELRDRESDAAKKVKNSLDIVEQMQVEKAQCDMETRRLKDELERYQKRIREMIHDHSQRLHEEKLQVEKKYKQELDQLNNEMTLEMDSLTKARLDLERQKRLEADLRREVQQKACTIEDLRQEMQMKIGYMQTELTHVLASKSGIEQELINNRLNAEKAERDGKQEASRLQAEINGLRKRLEQSDQELVRGQELIMNLNETVAQLQRENSLAKIRLEGHISTNPELENADVATIIQNMEEKHNRDMTELEQLIGAQNDLLDKLRQECKGLTDKLEETSRQYKKERAILEADRDKFIQVSKVAQEKCVELEQKVNFYSNSHEHMTNRLQKLEDDDKTRSARIFQLLTKQSGLLKENQRLQNDVTILKSKLTDQSSSKNNNRSLM